MPRAYIGLGANLEDPAAQVRRALTLLGASPGVKLVAQSRLYRSAPLGPPDQPDYCNAACVVATTHTPDRLLTVLHDVERQMGRVRPPVRWAARLIDLDLLHYEGVASAGPRLVLPHPELPRRNFVVVPLAEVAPELEVPGVGRVADVAAQLGTAGLMPW